MSTPVIVPPRCRPGPTRAGAEAILRRKVPCRPSSTGGDFDLLLKRKSPEGEDVGRSSNDRLLDSPGIERSPTTMTFRAF